MPLVFIIMENLTLIKIIRVAKISCFFFSERDRIRQEMIALKDDVKTLHAQQKVLGAQEKRQNKHCEVSKRFEATHINLQLFYRTVYLGMEEIFIGAKVGDDRKNMFCALSLTWNLCQLNLTAFCVCLISSAACLNIVIRIKLLSPDKFDADIVMRILDTCSENSA